MQQAAEAPPSGLKLKEPLPCPDLHCRGQGRFHFLQGRACPEGSEGGKVMNGSHGHLGGQCSRQRDHQVQRSWGRRPPGTVLN